MVKEKANSSLRAKILKTAEELILSKGFVATSIDEICRKLKITKGGFFHYFKSKEALGAVLLEACCEQIHVATPKNDQEDPFQKILDRIDESIKGLEAQGKPGCLMGYLTQELFDTHPAIRKRCCEGFSQWTESIAKDLAAAKKMYAPKAKFEPRALAEYWISILEGSQILAKAKQDKTVVKENLTHLKNYFRMLFKQ